MTDEIYIPASAFEVKPWWNERPSDERIQEIRSFILRTNQPHLWAGQTYNAPPDDAIIDYLTEFRLPNSKPLAPCPCCTPRHPKYRHGMVAHFPNERVIRIMGHDCFKTINAEGHTEALRKYHRDLKRKRDIAYLLGNLDKVPDFVAAIERVAPIAHAIDKFRNDVCSTFAEVLRTDLWDYVRTGELRVTRTLPRPGEGGDVTIIETYGRIAGQDLLKKRSKKLGIKLDQAACGLRQIDFGVQFSERVREMSDDDRVQTAKLLANGIKTAEDIFAAIDELRQFTSAATLATLNGWARAEGCPVKMHVELNRGKLYVGLTDHEFRPINAPDAYFDVLPTLPKLAHRAAAE